MYGDHFNPVPFYVPWTPEGDLSLPKGHGKPIAVGCSSQGHLGWLTEVDEYCRKNGPGLLCDSLGWVFPVTGSLRGKLWYEWVMPDGTLSRSLNHYTKHPTFEAACAQLLSAYQAPTMFGIWMNKEPSHVVKRH